MILLKKKKRKGRAAPLLFSPPPYHTNKILKKYLFRKTKLSHKNFSNQFLFQKIVMHGLDAIIVHLKYQNNYK